MQRNYKSRLLKLALCSLTAAVIMSGCGQNGAGDPEGAGNQQRNTPVTLTVWDKGGGMGDAVRKLIDDFNSEHTDIQANLVHQGSDSYEDTVRLAFQSRQGPDLFVVNGPEKLYQAGFLLPLDDILSEETLAIYKPHGRKGSTIFNDQLYAASTSAVTIRLVYNKDLFREAGLDPEQPPATFSELKAYAQAISEAGNGEYFGLGLPMKWSGFMDWHIDPLVLATDLNLTKKGLFNRSEQVYETAKYAPVIEVMREIVSNKWAYPGASTLDNDPMRSAFAEGKIGMYMGASWDIATLNEQFNTTVDWAAAHIPVEDGKEALQHISNAGQPWSVSADTKHPQEVGVLLEYLLGEQVSQSLQKQGLLNSLHPAAATEESMPEGVEQFKYFIPAELDRQFPGDPTGFLKIQGKSYQDTIIELILTDQPIIETLEAVSDTYTEAYNKAVQDGAIDEELYRKD
ncbi:ABC transporter substrate-binding protein [Paenibacillus sp. 1P07SE]|uniref:ABC transporter substrate-binding protein n=1 Tax=Paenibacillus sp. 1P07SE TaxID=3132209 RepID=UPI0039A6B67E